MPYCLQPALCSLPPSHRCCLHAMRVGRWRGLSMEDAGRLVRRFFCHMTSGAVRGVVGRLAVGSCFLWSWFVSVSLAFPVVCSEPLCRDPSDQLGSHLSQGCRALATQPPLLFWSLPASFCFPPSSYPSHLVELEMNLEGLMQPPLNTPAVGSAACRHFHLFLIPVLRPVGIRVGD